MSEWEDKQYFWVVICKNRKFHESHQSFWGGYKIFLGETDAYSPMPTVPSRISVECNGCHKVFEYNSKEILRFESDPLEAFEEHPLFANRFDASDPHLAHTHLRAF